MFSSAVSRAAFLLLLCSCTNSSERLQPDDSLTGPDWRKAQNGVQIMRNYYVDQPYVAVLPNGDWRVFMTSNTDHEGVPGQHIVSSVSKNKGKTWSGPELIDPDTRLSSSWAVPYLTPTNRLYVFYTYNGDNVMDINGKPLDPKTFGNNSMLGWYCFRFSEDFGKTWSDRYRIPLRLTKADLNNDWKGKVQMFWGIDRPKRMASGVMFGFSKIGKYLIDQSEGWFMHSPNLDTERDPTKLVWNQLPEGDLGVRDPAWGSRQEEHNFVELSDGTLYCVFRTQRGFPAFATSRDQGKTWSAPMPITYHATGRPLKNPIACPRIWKCRNGKYLLWYHNTFFDNDRNPAWLAGGIETNGSIQWSQPDMVLYSTVLPQRFSYPDLIEEGTQFWFTETQKSIARVHPLSPTLVQGLWEQFTNEKPVGDRLLWQETTPAARSSLDPPFRLPGLEDGSFTIEFRVKFDSLGVGQVLLDTRRVSSSVAQEKGILITTGSDQTLLFQMNDGYKTAQIYTDQKLFTQIGKWYHVAFVVDGRANVLTALVDGRLCDEGNRVALGRQGWVRFDDLMTDVNGNGAMQMAPSLRGQLKDFRIHGRYLRTTEVIGNYRAGL